jgi:sensor histidine kinase YesM
MEHKRNFWLLQIGGWAAYGIIVAIYSIPLLNDQGMVAYRGALTVSCFLGTFVLRWACRREWNRGFRFPRSMINVLLWCVVLTWVCSAVAIKAEYMWGAELRPFNLLLSLTTVTNVGFIFLSWAALYFGIKYYQTVEEERRRVLAAERHAREAELRALRYQIHPHFLFNTLNAISTLVTEAENGIAVAMISRLADFFRITLEGPSTDEVNLEEELSLTKHYLEIEKLRLGDRLRVEIHVDPELLSNLVPHLVLQPLVENAIRHGIAPRPGAGTLTVAAERSVEHLTITVTDDGLGEQARSNTSNGDRIGIGLKNISQRLADLYGDASGLQLSWPAKGGCEATLRIPWNRSGRLTRINVEV